MGIFVVGFMERSWCHVVGERKLSQRRWGKNWSHASVARYDASKWWNRNYNFSYNFVHISARTMILVASERSHRDASKWYKIYPEKCRLSPKFIVYPKKFVVYLLITYHGIKQHLSPVLSFILRLSFIPVRFSVP